VTQKVLQSHNVNQLGRNSQSYQIGEFTVNNINKQRRVC